MFFSGHIVLLPDISAEFALDTLERIVDGFDVAVQMLGDFLISFPFQIAGKNNDL